MEIQDIEDKLDAIVTELISLNYSMDDLSSFISKISYGKNLTEFLEQLSLSELHSQIKTFKSTNPEPEQYDGAARFLEDILKTIDLDKFPVFALHPFLIKEAAKKLEADAKDTEGQIDSINIVKDDQVDTDHQKQQSLEEKDIVEKKDEVIGENFKVEEHNLNEEQIKVEINRESQLEDEFNQITNGLEQARTEEDFDAIQEDPYFGDLSSVEEDSSFGNKNKYKEELADKVDFIPDSVTDLNADDSKKIIETGAQGLELSESSTENIELKISAIKTENLQLMKQKPTIKLIK